MAKKQRKPLLAKKQKMNWKLVAIVFGILLVGITALALKANVVYKSKAYTGCASSFRECKDSCSYELGDATGGDGNAADGKTNRAIGACKKFCKSLKRSCEKGTSMP